MTGARLPTDGDFDVKKLAEARVGHPAIFTCRVGRVLSMQEVRAILSGWANAWRAAGYSETPVLLILEKDVGITALDDAGLARIGLARVADLRH